VASRTAGCQRRDEGVQRTQRQLRDSGKAKTTWIRAGTELLATDGRDLTISGVLMAGNPDASCTTTTLLALNCDDSFS
jgi:hypothetical protein